MPHNRPRIATRALILHENRLLLVNAYRGNRSNLWCAPGGGVNAGSSLPENLKREIHEETGLEITVGPVVLVNEFHDPQSGFHQIEVYFRGFIQSGEIDPNWKDPEGIVTQRRFFTREELAHIRFKPDLLPKAAWGEDYAFYDPLEVIQT